GFYEYVRVGPAELEDDLLQVAAGRLGDHGAGPLGAGQRHASQPRVGDHRGDLLVGREDVDVYAVRHARVLHDLRDRQGRGRAVFRVLEYDGVADDQVGRREPGHLVVRVVPRHHAEYRADGPVLDPCGVVAGQRFVGEEAGAVVGVVVEDGGAELGLADGLRGPLAHLLGDQRGQVGGALGEQL